jgi:diguanylate cyclase (GGDEF)-like protein
MVKLTFDTLILVVAAGVLSWSYFFGPLIVTNEADLLKLTVALAYPAIDLILFSLLVVIALNPEGWRGLGTILFSVGVGLYIVGDIVYTLLVTAGTYVSGHPISVVWVVSFMFITLASWVERRPAHRVLLSGTASSWTPYAPYFAIMSSYALLATSHVHERGSDEGAQLIYVGVLSGAALVTLLVVTRQVLTLRENMQLSRQLGQLNLELEERVEQRTAELDQANHTLKAFSQNLEAKVRERTAELEASQVLLAHQAQHDALTSLPNRTLFEDRLQLAVKTASRLNESLAVFFIDLDGFKFVNDTLGHSAGDILLQKVARRLEGSVRYNDTVARLGGDEFVILAPSLSSPEDAERVVGKVLTSLRKPFVLNGFETPIGASIGISLYPQDSLDAATLQRHADIAMYQAKQSGKNDARFYAPEMNLAALERLEVETHLRGALERGEFSLAYQPQWDTRTTTLVSLKPCCAGITPY